MLATLASLNSLLLPALAQAMQEPYTEMSPLMPSDLLAENEQLKAQMKDLQFYKLFYNTLPAFMHSDLNAMCGDGTLEWDKEEGYVTLEGEDEDGGEEVVESSDSE